MARKLFKHNDEDVLGTDLDTEIKKVDDFQIEVIGSTAAIDRDGESITPEGWDIKNFKKNPVILLNHNYYGLPIAKAENVRVQDGKLVFKIKFPEEGVSAEADTVRKLAKGGFINASSVGFKAREWKDGQSEKEPRRTYLKQELLELSLVTVPSNPEAIISEKHFQPAIEKGVVTQEEISRLITALTNMKSIAVDVYSKAEVDKLCNEIKALVDGITKGLRPIIEPMVIEIIENKKFKDGYNDIIFGADGKKALCPNQGIDELIKSVQKTIKETIERN